MKLFLKLLLFFLILLNSNFSFSQSKINEEVSLIKNSKLEIDEKIKKTKTLLKQKDFLGNLESKSDAYHCLGLYYNSKKDYEQAIIETQKAIAIRKELIGIDYKYFNSLFNLSTYYRALGNVSEQKKILQTIISFQKKNKFSYYAYTNLSKVYSNAGDFYNAIDCLTKVIKASEGDGRSKKMLLIAYRTSIFNYSKMEKLPENAIDIIEYYAQESEQFKGNDLKTIAFYTNLGRVYNKIGDNEKGIKYSKKALFISLKLKDFDRAGTIYNNIGQFYSKQANYKLANEFYSKALAVTNNPVTKADVYNNQGFYLQTDKSINKNAYYNKALFTILDIPNSTNAVSFLPSIDIIKKSLFKIDIKGYLIDKANNFLAAYNEENKKEYLEHAKETLYLIDELVSIIRLDSEVEKSKLFWINRGVNVYMLATKVCHILNKPEEGFYFMEKNKYLLLLENLDRVKIGSNINNDKKISNTLKNGTNILSLDKVINKYVSKNTSLVEYILNEDYGYGIFCEKEGVYFFKIEDVPNLLKEVELIKKQFNSKFNTAEAFEDYNNIAYRAFKKIFPFKNALEKISNKKLLVISDYKLHNLPFSALVVNDYTTIKLDYLLKHTEISYLHSTSVDTRINNETVITNNKVLGFAPTVFNNKTLSNLKESEEEMKKYTSFLPIELKFREEATKKELFSNVKQNYSIIHINSHAGYTTNKEPWLSLYDGNVSLQEIYELKGRTELIILDACKTNSGKQEIGEGIMSLSRAFFHSGTKSIIASQWNVNEKSNNKILHTFYSNIKAGKTKSNALRNAKLEYLKNHQLEETSPYFWASLTLTGNPEAIKITSNTSIWIIVLIAILILSLLFLSIKKRKSSLS